MLATPPAGRPRRTLQLRDYVSVLMTLVGLAVILPFIVGGACYVDEEEERQRMYYASLNNMYRAALERQVDVKAEGSTPSNADAGGVRPSARAGRVGRSVFLRSAELPAGTPVDLSWSPPPGATGFELTPLPANPAGPPPFLFPDLPLSAAGSPTPAVVVAYDAPPGSAAAGTTSLVDTFVTTTPDGSSYAGTFREPIDGAAPATPGAVTSARGQADAVERAAAVEPPDFSIADVYFDSDGTEMTTLLCQEIVDLLQSDRTFVATRFPAPAAADPRWAALPLVSSPQPDYTPSLALEQWWPSATFVKLPAAVAPERISFAENVLPGAAGERWMTLKARPTPRVTCPDGLSITGGYSFRAWVPLDFTDLPDACADCQLPSYLCYEGQEPPLSATTLAMRALGLERRADAAQAEGITCVGPITVRLVDQASPSPPFALHGANVGATVPPSTIRAHHLLAPLKPVSPVVTLAASSSLGLDWRFYRSADDAPDYSQPITSPITLTSFFDFWAVADVPEGVQGTESLTVTASSSSPAGSTSAADLFWIGEWQPPLVITPQVAVTPEGVYPGRAVTVSGTLPDGAYRLAVVPNGTFTAGECYSGVQTAFTDVQVAGGVLPPTVAWASAEAGSYDLLVLGGACTVAVAPTGSAIEGSAVGDGWAVVTGDDMAEAPGFTVGPPLRRRLRWP